MAHLHQIHATQVSDTKNPTARWDFLSNALSYFAFVYESVILCSLGSKSVILNL